MHSTLGYAKIKQEGCMKKKIGWQKYEDVIEQNMSSPVLQSMIDHIQERMSTENDEVDENYEYEEDQEIKNDLNMSMIPLSPQLIEDITMLSNFDCWMAHTNFDVTNRIKDELNTTEGIELLKVCSRYRFFIGIGKMFKFSDVRKNIENKLLKGD